MILTGKSGVFGVIGWPIAHSLSPVMHNAALAVAQLDSVYVPFAVEPEGLSAALLGLPALGVRGINVTIPHKQTIMPLLERVDQTASAIGAVNTVVFHREGNRPIATGYNTDGAGFLADVQAQGWHVHNRPIIVLGAGGSARAIIYTLLLVGAELHLFARRLEQAEQLKTQLRPFAPTDTLACYPIEALPTLSPRLTAPLIINTTPLGMAPHTDDSIWPDHLPFPAGSQLYDLVYRPAQTKFLRQGAEQGLATCNGIGMLIQQGALAFQLWTGQSPDVLAMRRALAPYMA